MFTVRGFHIRIMIYPPRYHLMLSMGYPATGHVTLKVSPATADISPMTRIYGVPATQIMSKTKHYAHNKP